MRLSEKTGEARVYRRCLAAAQRQAGSQRGVTGMPRPASDCEAIEAQIDRLRSPDLDELRTLWRVTFRSSPPPAFTKDLIARFLSWHIQEQAFGELDPETAKISTASHGAASRERIAPGASSPAPCSCSNTRASGTPSRSFQLKVSRV